MKTYKELNLKKLRDDNGLDFAHYTFKPGQCSCCYGPDDQAAIYWVNRKKNWNKHTQYILFKNADNGSGYVTRNDVICMPPQHLLKKKHHWYIPSERHTVCIAWRFPMEKMDGVLQSLSEQLDDDYVVLRPKDEYECIQIVCRDRLTEKEKAQVFQPK